MPRLGSDDELLPRGDHLDAKVAEEANAIDDPLARAPGVAGATDLGDGRPTLVLDLIELGARVASRERMS